jgi:hypothetical protein
MADYCNNIILLLSQKGKQCVADFTTIVTIIIMPLLASYAAMHDDSK